VYVAFGNGNTPTVGVNQHMVVSCAPRTIAASRQLDRAGEDHRRLRDTAVRPVASTACAVGRQCLPPNGYRLDDFTQGSLSRIIPANLLCMGRFPERAPNCNPMAPRQRHDTLRQRRLLFLFDQRGATWSAAKNLTPKSKFGPTAQWMPWSGVTPTAGRCGRVYDRSYGNCEPVAATTSRCGRQESSHRSATVSYHRITTASMPNLVVANNPIEAGFLGDYMCSPGRNGRPNIVWADTRGLHGA